MKCNAMAPAFSSSFGLLPSVVLVVRLTAAG